MNRFLILSVFILLMVATPLSAQIMLGENTLIHFASVDEAREVLTLRDDFVQRMSPFDRAARMKTDRDISEKEYLDFVGKNILAWNESERQIVTAAFQVVQKELESLSLPFPPKVFIAKTTGNEEGGAAYTRSNVIVFPEAELKRSQAKIQKIFCHELFHVLSRANPELREKLYSAIGFEACGEIAFPSEFKARKITNPDAPRNDHCIRLQIEGKECWTVPILFSSTERYDKVRGGKFFRYLQFQFLLVDWIDKSTIAKPIYENQNPKLVDMNHLSGFYEQVGKNTGYIIHPEEILADNFALLVLGADNVASPVIIKKLENILKGKGITEPAVSTDVDKP